MSVGRLVVSLALAVVAAAPTTTPVLSLHTPGNLPCCPGLVAAAVAGANATERSTQCDPPPICGCVHADVVVASCWGFKPQDSTLALQAALDSGAKTVVVPAMGSPWVLRANGTKFGALQLRSNQQVHSSTAVVSKLLSQWPAGDP